MKKKDEFAKKMTEKLIEDSLIKNNVSDYKIKEIKKMFNNSLSDNLDEPIEVVIDKINKSFYAKGDRLYTSSGEFLKNIKYLELFQKEIFSNIKNNELKVIYDDCVLNDEVIYLIYRINNKMFFEYLLLDERKKKFIIKKEMFNFSYKKNKKMSNDEIKQLINAIKEYNKKDDIFHISKETERYPNIQKINYNKKQKKLLFLGFFFRYGLIFFAISLPLLLGLIGKLFEIQEIMKYFLIPSFALPMIIMGVDYILGCIYEWEHILLVNQSAYHKKMDPNDLNWNDISKKEFIGIGILFLVLGLAILIIAFINYFK